MYTRYLSFSSIMLSTPDFSRSCGVLKNSVKTAATAETAHANQKAPDAASENPYRNGSANRGSAPIKNELSPLSDSPIVSGCCNTSMIAVFVGSCCTAGSASAERRFSASLVSLKACASASGMREYSSEKTAAVPAVPPQLPKECGAAGRDAHIARPDRVLRSDREGLQKLPEAEPHE